jgi:carbon storage regulator
MLTLTRRKGERLNVGLSVEITVLEISGGRVRLGITAPRRLPVHRGEVVERMELANRAALARGATINEGHSTLNFPEGLIGMPEHRELVLCESTEDPALFVLVSKTAPCIQLAVIEAKLVIPNYPIREACVAADFEHEESVVALVATMDSDSKRGFLNMQAPIVMGLQSRHGRQVILLRDDLPLRHEFHLPLLAAGAPAPDAPPEAPAQP